eukprot:jgi/Psemu1/54580/gm1.54580_g
MSLLRATASSGPAVLAGANTDGTPVSWFEANWPFFTWAIFLFGSGMLAATYKRRDDYWYGWLAMVSYCLHQSEEHAYDLRGWRYAFVPSLNTGPISSMFAETCTGAEDPLGCPLDPKLTLYVNVVLIWIGFGSCMVAATLDPNRFLFGGSLNWGTAVVNGAMGHVLPAVLTRSYNPGVVQSLVMVPLGIHRIVASGRPFLCLAHGILNHAALIAGIKAVYSLGLDEAVVMTAAMLAVCPVSTLVISNHVSKQCTAATRGHKTQ